MPSRRHSSAMLSSPRSPSSTTRIFSSAEKCRRVARRMSLIASSGGCFSGPDFCLIFAPCGYDDPEILPTRKPPTVSKALTADTRAHNHFNQERYLVTRQVFKQRHLAALIECEPADIIIAWAPGCFAPQSSNRYSDTGPDRAHAAAPKSSLTEARLPGLCGSTDRRQSQSSGF